MPNNGWIHKQNVVHTDNGILFSLGKERHFNKSTAQMNLEDITVSEIRANTTGFHLEEVPGGVTFMRTESGMVVARG